MTARESQKWLGKVGLLATEGMLVAVSVQDVREVFGRVDLLVIPQAGEGSVWVSAERVRIGGQA